MSWLPSASNLFRRKFAISPSCFKCGFSNESIFHALWCCPFSKKIWKTCPSNHPSWSPPLEGSYKLNVDAAIDSNKCICGIGFVIRDYQGSVMDGCSKLWHFPLNVKAAKLMTIKEGLKFARKGGWTPVYVASDCVSVIALLNSNSRIFNNLGVLIDETLFWLTFIIFGVSLLVIDLLILLLTC
ncbi:hypothetical protein UlMin_039054 [Ulmus minor]